MELMLAALLRDASSRDGRMMWDTMHDLQYPLLDLKYQGLWSILDLFHANPCWGWLNPNATARDATSARATQLNAVLQGLVTASNADANTYTNFDLTYLDYPIDEAVVQQWAAGGHGRAGKDLFEPIGGGHPSTTAHILMAQTIWAELEKNHPEILGPVNPNNAKIAQLFGDQGGY